MISLIVKMASKHDFALEYDFIKSRLGCDFVLRSIPMMNYSDKRVVLIGTPESEVYSVDGYLYVKNVSYWTRDLYLVVPNNVDQLKYQDDALDCVRNTTVSIFAWKKDSCKSISVYSTNDYSYNNIGLLDLWCGKIKKISKLCSRGIHTNTNIMLHGKPGTGKTRFAISLAVRCKRPVIIVDPRNEFSFGGDGHVNPVFLFEEIDKLLMPNGDFFGEGLLVDQLLQFLDGGLRPNGSIILMTCNDYERVKNNKVLSRKGRITGEIEFGGITEDDCKFVCGEYYEGADHVQLWNQVKSAKLTISDLSAFVSEGFLTDKSFAELISEAKSLKAESVERLTHYY
jgi:hypothetical protein